MSNPFQDQLLKTGLVSKKQAHKARQDKNKQQHSKNSKVTDETKIKVQRAAEEKAKRDRELNKKRVEQQRQKAISVEINQLITSNCLSRDENCDIVYNFEHNKKIKRIYINAEMKQQVINGQLGIARIEGRYELVPLDIAEKIQQRNENRIVIFNEEENTSDEDYSSSKYQIPDDLTW
ncbi:DUF2058 domain-containing protein [uncultured Eudoraea sp.]|uniref:DUF2058 domain-containing protein n=1 Tax=uncultured Eudoraea sp. TaxID=1035614 RepID=UPI0026120457|nr:DUF2058 domain-containing protein [uncultured Eudoraea sp.]